jgi:hypothetical protein
VTTYRGTAARVGGHSPTAECAPRLRAGMTAKHRRLVAEDAAVAGSRCAAAQRSSTLNIRVTAQRCRLVTQDAAMAGSRCATTQRAPGLKVRMTAQRRRLAAEEAATGSSVGAAAQRAAALQVGMAAGSATFVADKPSRRDIAACGCLGADRGASQSGRRRTGHPGRRGSGNARATEAAPTDPERRTAASRGLLADRHAAQRARESGRRVVRESSLSIQVRGAVGAHGSIAARGPVGTAARRAHVATLAKCRAALCGGLAAEPGATGECPAALCGGLAA